MAASATAAAAEAASAQPPCVADDDEPAPSSSTPHGGGDAGAPPKAPTPASAPAPAPPLLPVFRPRCLTVGRGLPPTTTTTITTTSQKRPAPSAAAADPPPPPSSASSSSSGARGHHLWRRHATGSYPAYYCRRKPRRVDSSATTTTDNAGGQEGDAAGKTGEDARLAVLKEEWFRGKAHLDVGTNTGKVAWEIYRRFGTRRLLGVDIDAGLVAAAKTKLAHAGRRDGRDYAAAGVAFARCDFVNDEAEALQAAPFDVVTCLSVTKHVHLQGGDAALLRLFQRAHALLRPGGRLVLEPQPWPSYRKRKHASPASRRHYPLLRLRPPFVETLLGPDVGFAAVEALGMPPEAPEGYRRPLFCFVKAKSGDGDGAEAVPAPS